jgi:fatty-acyl-CoA synthase
LELHYATLWEALSDEIGDRDAIVHGSQRRTWSEYETRAARLASAFLDAGLGADSKIGMYLYNGNEYLETQFAGMKIRGVPINVNYRYLDDELLYLLDNSDAEALVFHTSLGDRVARVMERANKVRLWIEDLSIRPKADTRSCSAGGDFGDFLQHVTWRKTSVLPRVARYLVSKFEPVRGSTAVNLNLDSRCEGVDN